MKQFLTILIAAVLWFSLLGYMFIGATLQESYKITPASEINP